MPNFVPEGKIRIGRVPFDNSYRHTMTFDSAQAQTDYFSSVCPTALSRNDYTYVRMSNSIRVPFNAEQLYTYNYVMYQNANYGTKWFYAFIVGINYLNKATTELVLELDVMQTWYFDYTLTEGFVEREHVSDDTPGAHTVPEPEMPLLYSCEYQSLGLSARSIVVQTTQAPKSDFDWWENITNAVTDTFQGGIYDGAWSGGGYLAFSMETEDSRNELKAFFEIMNRCGAAEAITSVFSYPSKLLEGKVGSDFRVAEKTFSENHWFSPAFSRKSLGGYVPRNKKLFTYPYNYLMLIDNTGKKAQYRWERFEKSSPGATGSTQYWFRCFTSLSPDATLIMIPHEYNGNDDSYPDMFVSQLTVPMSWIYSAYQNWLAQNTLSVATSLASVAMPFALGAAGTIGRAAGYLGMGAGAHNRLVSQYGADAVSAVGRDMAYSSTQGLGEQAVGSALGALGVASDWARMKSVPDSLQGRVSDTSLMGADLQEPYFFNMYPTEEYCKIVDEFFDMYGYEVDRVKVPNRTGRPSWNYVKMRNSCHRGNVPSQDMAQINEIYDSGITFWHTSDVGNYSLPNGA